MSSIEGKTNIAAGATGVISNVCLDTNTLLHRRNLIRPAMVE
jgi:hypothetical protein